MGDDSLYDPMPTDMRTKPPAPAPQQRPIAQSFDHVGPAPTRVPADILHQSAMARFHSSPVDGNSLSRSVSAKAFASPNSSPLPSRIGDSSPSRDLALKTPPPQPRIGHANTHTGGVRVVARRDSGGVQPPIAASPSGEQHNYTPMLANAVSKLPALSSPMVRQLSHSISEAGSPRLDDSGKPVPASRELLIRHAIKDVPTFPQEAAPADPEVTMAQIKQKLDALPPDRLQAILREIECPSPKLSTPPYPPNSPSLVLSFAHPSLTTLPSRSALLSLPGSGDNSPTSTPPRIPSGTAYSPLVKDWNREYQHLLSQPDSVSKFERLRDLAADFAYAAETYGRIIISESDLPDSEKTIPPASMGGRAGGTKYIAQGILFKFALDTEGFYASDEGAVRAAGHELKGVQAYYNTRIPMLKTPLMVLIDYRGFRLTCISLVPIDKNTIKYGSSDGGLTVHADIDELNELMREAARKINLKGHIVGDKMLYAPGDIEAHLGKDGRFYVVDCARVFPPENPPTNLDEMEKGALLFKLLRPEYVQSLLSPLSSDSFSGFQRNDPNIYVHNRETKDASDVLQQEYIPSFAYKLDKGFEDTKSLRDFSSFAPKFHRAGINMRFLNHVRHFCTKPGLRKLLLSEAVARVLKNTLREKLREAQRRLRLPLEHPYRELVINFLNLVIGGTNAQETELFWNGTVKQRLKLKFPLIPPNIGEDEPVEQVATMDLRVSVELVAVVRILVSMAGVIVSERALADLAAARVTDNFILIHPDVVGLATKPKQMSIIYEAMDRWLYEKATSDSKESSRCLWALVKQPQNNMKGDAHLFEAWGKLLFQHATKAAGTRETTYSADEVVTLLQTADEKFESASGIDSNSVGMFVAWGHMLAFWAQNYPPDDGLDTLWKRSGEKFQKYTCFVDSWVILSCLAEIESEYRAIIIGRQRVEDLLSDSLSPTAKSFAVLFRAAQYSPQLMAIFQQRFCSLTNLILDGCVTLTDGMLTSLLNDVGEKATSLSLRGCIQVTDLSVIPLLVKCARIASLDLSFTRVTEKVFVDLPRLQSLTSLSIGGCTELSAKGILAVIKKMPHLTSLVIPNELSSSLKQIQLALPVAKIRPEAPSRYDLISSPSADGARLGVERKGMLFLLKYKSQKWESAYIILEKDRISVYADAKTQMSSEDILLDGLSSCTIAPPTEARAMDSSPARGKPTYVERPFCFKIVAGSAKGKVRYPARTRYLCGQSAEERDAWIIAVCNNIALCKR